LFNILSIFYIKKLKKAIKLFLNYGLFESYGGIYDHEFVMFKLEKTLLMSAFV